MPMASATTSAIVLPYVSVPTLTHIKRADIPWIRDTWTAFRFWEKCRGAWFEPLVWPLWMALSVTGTVGWRTLAIAVMVVIAFDLVRAGARSRSLLLVMHLSRPFAYMFVLIASFAWVGYGGGDTSVRFLAIGLLLFCVFTAVFGIKDCRESIRLSRLPLPEPARVWMAHFREQLGLCSTSLALPKLWLQATGLSSLELSRSGEMLVASKSTELYFAADDEVTLETIRPAGAHVGGLFKLTFGTKIFKVYLFPRDFEALVSFLAAARPVEPSPARGAAPGHARG
jgi:hypothetical protein